MARPKKKRINQTNSQTAKKALGRRAAQGVKSLPAWKRPTPATSSWFACTSSWSAHLPGRSNFIQQASTMLSSSTGSFDMKSRSGSHGPRSPPLDQLPCTKRRSSSAPLPGSLDRPPWLCQGNQGTNTLQYPDKDNVFFILCIWCVRSSFEKEWHGTPI